MNANEDMEIAHSEYKSYLSREQRQRLAYEEAERDERIKAYTVGA